MLRKRRNGFTIVELLIVIVVIAILAAITVVAYNGIQSRGKITQTRSALASLKRSMLGFKAIHGELPPLGDSWNFSTNPPNCADFITVLTSLRDANFTGNAPQDAWGSCYGYDDNDCNSGQNSSSWVVSAGPDRLTDTSDDIRIQISENC